MRFLTISIVLLGAVTMLGCAEADSRQTSPLPATTEAAMQTVDVTTIPFTTITGETASLSDYAGKAILIVNTASECGYTKQYAGLEKLYRDKRDDGLVIIGFPANNFGGQEPGSNEEILTFCQTRFDVTFPMMAKVSVTGDDKHPLFVHLTGQPEMTGEIKWNFSKFVLDRNGRLITRFGSGTSPDDKKLLTAIDKALGLQKN